MLVVKFHIGNDLHSRERIEQPPAHGVTPNEEVDRRTKSDAAGNIVRYRRLRKGPLFADLRLNTRLQPQIYHCIIQREDSPEILSWTQHDSLKSAMRSAKAELERIAAVDLALTA